MMRFEMNQAALIIQQNWRIQRQVRLQKALMRAKNAAMKAKVQQHRIAHTSSLWRCSPCPSARHFRRSAIALKPCALLACVPRTATWLRRSKA